MFDSSKSLALALFVERFYIPGDVITICLGKSTCAQCGIVVNVTPFEPGREGRAVLEISNTTPLPARIYAIMRDWRGFSSLNLMNHALSYAERNGKYQAQEGIATLSL